MAYVPIAGQQQEPSVIPGTPAAPVLDSGAQGLASLGGALDQTGKVLYHAQTQAAVANSYDTIAKAREDLQQQAGDLKAQMPDDPTGYQEKVHALVDSYAQPLVAAETNPTARQHLVRGLDIVGKQIVTQAYNWESQQLTSYRATQIDGQVDSATKMVAADQTQYDSSVGLLHDAINSVGFAPDVRQKLRDAATKQLLAAANQSYLENDPHGAYADYSKALGLKDVPPMLPPPSATPGSSAPAVDNPAAQELPVASRFPDNGGVDPELDRAIAAAAGNPKTLAILQGERASQVSITADRQKSIDAGFNPDTGNPMQPAAPAQVASSGASSTDTGPGYTLPLDPSHTSDATTATGKSFVDQLDTAQLVALRNEAHSRMLMGQAGARADLERQMQNVEQAARAGMPVPDIPRSAFDAAYPDKPTADAKFATLGAWQNFGTDVKTIQTMPGDQIAAYIDNIKPTDTTAPDFAARMQRWTAAAAAAQHVATARQEDPVAALTAQGVFRSNPLDLSNPSALQDELENRQQNSSTAQGTYLTSPAVFTKPEAKALATTIQGAPFAMQTQLLASLRNGLTDDATFRSALQQIHPDAPEVASAAALATLKPGYDLAAGFATPAAAAELALRGTAILHPSKQQKETDGVGATPLLPDPNQLEQAFAGAVGDAYAGHPGALKSDFQTFRAIYAGAAARDGVVVGADKSPNSNLVTEALNGSTGGLYSTNGHTIIKPYGMPDNVFAARYADAYSTALARNGIDAATHAPSDYPPVNADDGSYYLRSGAGYLTSPVNGQPVKVEVPTDLPTPEMRTRGAPPMAGAGRSYKGVIRQ